MASPEPTALNGGDPIIGIPCLIAAWAPTCERQPEQSETVRATGLPAEERPMKPSFGRRRWNSFRHAVAGLVCFVGEEEHAKFHLLVLLGATVLGASVGIASTEWALLYLAGGLVLVAELLNTAVENTCNAMTTESNPWIKKAKDTAAGGVLLSCAFALTIGGFIFGPKVWPEAQSSSNDLSEKQLNSPIPDKSK